MIDIVTVKEDLKTKWSKCQDAEQFGIAFGKACYDWKTKLSAPISTITIEDVLKELQIPDAPVNRWLTAYMQSEGIEIFHIEKRRNRSEPPDSFEDLRKLAKRMLNIGFKVLRDDPKINPSHLDAAKTWALCRVETKLYEAMAA